MEHQINWGLLLLFFGAVAGLILVEKMRSRPRLNARRSDFRRMESPAARQRRRAAQRATGHPTMSRSGFAR